MRRTSPARWRRCSTPKPSGSRRTGSNHPAHRSQAAAEGDPLHERVYRLSDDGLDAVQIARQTGQPTGQIELILALRA